MDVFVGQLRQLPPASGREILRHALIVGEDGGGGAELGTHVSYGCLAGGAEGASAGTKVLDNGVRAAGDGQLPSQPEDDIFRGRPAVHLAGQIDADELRIE